MAYKNVEHLDNEVQKALNIFLEGPNGFSLEGYESKKMDKCSATIIAGDIHVPQLVGNVEYVGSPYRIRFNDAFWH